MIRFLTFAFTWFFIRLFSILPFFVLDALGTLMFHLLDKLIHYRRSIIVKNLRNAFPEIDSKGINRIVRDFYRYFSRLIVENIKMYSMSLGRLEKHIRLKNPEVLRELYEKGKSVALISAHYGNWEWLLGLRKEVPHHTLGVYKVLNNPWFNRFFTRHRSSYKTEMVSMRDILRVLLKYRQENRQTLTLYISDQSPVWEEIQYWTTFLNQETPVYLGPEKMARKLGMAVVYFRVHVEPKHKYSVEAITVAEDARQIEDFRITEKHLSLLEEDIRRAPQYWLWSHRRWKLTEKRIRLESQGIYKFEGKFRKK